LDFYNSCWGILAPFVPIANAAQQPINMFAVSHILFLKRILLLE